jgi:hypothetical protein
MKFGFSLFGLREEHRLNMFDIVLRRIIGYPNRKVEKLHNEKHHIFILVIKHYLGDQIEEDELDTTLSINGGDEIFEKKKSTLKT